MNAIVHSKYLIVVGNSSRLPFYLSAFRLPK